MSEISHTAVLGAGVIGASWTALFLASGRSVNVYDPAPDTETKVRAYVQQAWPIMTEIGLTKRGNPDAVTFSTDPAAAIEGAEFIQENVPERLAIKHETFARIEPALEKTAIVASSASGLTLGQMQPGFKDPSKLILGHPFNPPHLIPLVEIMGNDKTAEDVVDRAEQFYADVGKTTIRVNKEVPGHVANRLQAAIWREAISLVMNGVATVEDVDKAISAGPGLRWAAMGPTMLFNLAAGERGLPAFFDHFTDTFNGWWDDLSELQIDQNVRNTIEAGVQEEAKGQSVEALSARRDAMLVAMLKATKDLRD